MLFKGRNIIGLDIGSRNIKAVQLKEVKGGFQLVKFGIAPLSTELIVDGSILDAPRVVEAIKELISKSNIKAKDVTISVSGHASVIIKRITFPLMSEKEMHESIKFNAEQYIPFNIEDVNMDYQILGQWPKENKMDVLIVAVKKDKVNEYISVTRDAGLNPVIVDVDAFALENMYEVNYEINAASNVALVNIGASMININILKGGVSIFTRDSSVGGDLISETIQRELNISYNDAERLKAGETIEGLSQEDITSALIVATEDVIGEVLRTFDYFRSTSNYAEDVNEVILSGGCSLMKDFISLLSEKIGLEIKVAEPFKNIRIPDSFDKAYIDKISPLAAVAIGLALRRVGDK